MIKYFLVVLSFLFFGSFCNAESLEPEQVMASQLATSTARTIPLTLGAGVEQEFKTLNNQKTFSGFSLSLGEVDFFNSFYCRLKSTGLGGTVIATSTISIGQINSYKWIKCDFDPVVNITASTSYAFDFRLLDNGGSDLGTPVELKASTNSYTFGAYRQYTNWTAFTLYANDDLAFKIWGQYATTTPTATSTECATTSVSFVTGLDIGKIYLNGTTSQGFVSQIIEIPFLLFLFFSIVLLFVFWLFFKIKKQFKK